MHRAALAAKADGGKDGAKDASAGNQDASEPAAADDSAEAARKAKEAQEKEQQEKEKEKRRRRKKKAAAASKKQKGPARRAKAHASGAHSGVVLAPYAE